MFRLQARRRRRQWSSCRSIGRLCLSPLWPACQHSSCPIREPKRSGMLRRPTALCLTKECWISQNVRTREMLRSEGKEGRKETPSEAWLQSVQSRKQPKTPYSVTFLSPSLDLSFRTLIFNHNTAIYT